MLDAVNAEGFGEARVEPLPEPSSLLPEDYLTHDEGEDPWAREG